MAIGDNIERDTLFPDFDKQKQSYEEEEELLGNGYSMPGSVSRKQQSEINSELEARIKALEAAALLTEADLYGNITYANDKFCEVSKYRKEEIIGKPHSILRHPDNPPSLFQEMWETIKSGRIFKGTYPNRAKDGSTYWVEATIAPVLDESGRPYKYIGIRFDITKRKQFEAEARAAYEEAEAKARESILVRNELNGRIKALDAAALMSESDLYGTITYVNPKFCEVAKYTAQEVIGKPHNILRHPANPKSLYKAMWETIQAGKIFQGTYRNRAKDGSTYWVEATIAPVLDEDGKPLKYIGIRFDVTNQQNQAAEMRGVTTAIGKSNGMIVYDMDGRITEVNDMCLEAVGFEEAELIGRHHDDLCPREDKVLRENRELWDNLKKGQFQVSTYKRRNKKGEIRWLEGSYNPIADIDGQIIRVIQYFQDVTERRTVNSENRGKIASLDKSNGIVEFALDGTILNANELFQEISGFRLEELVGKHHSILCTPQYARSDEYKQFWKKLNRGEFDRDTYKRVAKNGKELWLEATYNPLTDDEGNLVKVVQVCQDATARRTANGENRGKLAAIDKSYAVIEFNLDGSIITANDLFLKTVGYRKEEIVGKHHRIFCDGAYANSAEYREFWEKLRKGEFQNGEYMRINKEGKPVWIRATYNPILNLDGEPFKVVKYAQDITDFKVSLNALSNFLQALRQGNFDAQIDLQNIRLSGDLAVMIDNNLALRDNLKQIILEIKRVVELAGQEGQLTERLKMGNVAGAWKELVDSINDLLHSISNPVLTINEAITSLSMGDLTNKVNLQSKGDIQNMANALNIAVRNLNRLLKDIQKSSTTVGASSDEMTLKFAEMEKNTGHVVAAIEQISQGMREQVARTDESSKLVEGILKSTGEMGQKAEVITKSAEAGMESCQSGMSIMKKLVENMQEISNSAASTSTTIEVLTGRSEEISRTLNVITDIAAQTNLLALNAAIEAARAGDAGRGFAVVAEEIRKLAEDSRKSAVGIDKVIKDVQKDVNLATRAIQQMETNVRNGNSATHEAEKLFENILDSSKGTFRLSQDVLYASGQQKEAIGTIVKNIEKIVVVSEQTARNTDGVVKAANMLNTSVGEVLGTSKALNTISSQLKDDLSKFKLSQD